MELRQIKYFLVLCQVGTFTRAAAISGISQPSLSIAIRRLEHELGGPLFDRGRPVRLSPFGEAVKARFEAIMCEIDRIHQLRVPVPEGLTHSANDQEDRHDMAPLRLP